jgi:hypothetical protein
VVREEFEAVYADFDAGGVDENQEAMEALLESGLERVEPDAGEVEQWREKVAVSNSQAADAGAFDPELRDRMLQILAEYRAGQAP